MDKNQRNHIGNALLFMCRYSYNRKTSADMACNSALKALWEYVPETHRNIIIEEIKSDATDLDKGRFSLWFDFLEWQKNQRISE